MKREREGVGKVEGECGKSEQKKKDRVREREMGERERGLR